MMSFTARIELGVAGYRHGVEEFAADTFDGLKAAIKQRIDAFAGELMAAQERNGDLRGYAPEFANGYPTLPFEPELGEDFTATVLDLRMDGTELGYRSRGYGRLRRELGVH
jgi:hypothetical protein